MQHEKVNASQQSANDTSGNSVSSKERRDFAIPLATVLTIGTLFVIGISGTVPIFWPHILIMFAIFFAVWFVVGMAIYPCSRGFKIAMSLCALAGLGFWGGSELQRSRPDWNVRGLNPARPGFKPTVILLAGTMERMGDVNNTGSAYFEIRMRGRDYYYGVQWRGHSWKRGSWNDLELGLPEFSGNFTQRYTDFGHQGGGGRVALSEAELLAGRRLWQGNEFIGAKAPDQYTQRDTTERFSQWKQYGPFQIPTRIELSNNRMREVYHVRRVDFLTEPDTNWFYLIKQKRFDRSRGLWKTNLYEVGWDGDYNR